MGGSSCRLCGSADAAQCLREIERSLGGNSGERPAGGRRKCGGWKGPCFGCTRLVISNRNSFSLRIFARLPDIRIFSVLTNAIRLPFNSILATTEHKRPARCLSPLTTIVDSESANKNLYTFSIRICFNKFFN